MVWQCDMRQRFFPLCVNTEPCAQVVMDSKGFSKLCKESKIMSGRLDLTRVDLCFTKCCDKVLLLRSYRPQARKKPSVCVCVLA